MENVMNRLNTDGLVTGGGAGGIACTIESAVHDITLTLVNHPPISTKRPTFLQVSGRWETSVSVDNAWVWQTVDSLLNNIVFMEQDASGPELARILGEESGLRANDRLTDFPDFKKQTKGAVTESKRVSVKSSAP
jgi:hypothetical protein